MKKIIECYYVNSDGQRVEKQDGVGVRYIYEDGSWEVYWLRDKKRIDDFCDKLRALWKTQPDLRFGQILYNAFGKEDIFYMEDGEALKKIKESFESYIT